MQTGTIIPPILSELKFRPILGCSSHFGQFWLVPNFGLKKKKSYLFLFGYKPFFFFFFFFFKYILLLLLSWVLDPSSSSGGFRTLLLLFFFFSSSGFQSCCQSAFPFLYVCYTGNVFDYLSASLLFLKCYVLCF